MIASLSSEESITHSNVSWTAFNSSSFFDSDPIKIVVNIHIFVYDFDP